MQCMKINKSRVQVKGLINKTQNSDMMGCFSFPTWDQFFFLLSNFNCIIITMKTNVLYPLNHTCDFWLFHKLVYYHNNCRAAPCRIVSQGRDPTYLVIHPHTNTWSPLALVYHHPDESASVCLYAWVSLEMCFMSFLSAQGRSMVEKKKKKSGRCSRLKATQVDLRRVVTEPPSQTPRETVRRRGWSKCVHMDFPVKATQLSSPS